MNKQFKKFLKVSAGVGLFILLTIVICETLKISFNIDSSSQIKIKKEFRIGDL